MPQGEPSFDAASPQQLRALRRAVEPVYAELERDPDGPRRDRGDRAGQGELAEPPAAVAACTPRTPPAPARDRPRRRLDDGHRPERRSPDYFDENWGHWVFVFDRGRFAITQENKTSCTWGYGTYAVNGARTSWTFLDGGGIAPNGATNRPGEYFVFDFSAYRDTLTLSPVGVRSLRSTSGPSLGVGSERPRPASQHPLPTTVGALNP